MQQTIWVVEWSRVALNGKITHGSKVFKKFSSATNHVTLMSLRGKLVSMSFTEV